MLTSEMARPVSAFVIGRHIQKEIVSQGHAGVGTFGTPVSDRSKRVAEFEFRATHRKPFWPNEPARNFTNYPNMHGIAQRGKGLLTSFRKKVLIRESLK